MLFGFRCDIGLAGAREVRLIPKTVRGMGFRLWRWAVVGCVAAGLVVVPRMVGASPATKAAASTKEALTSLLIGALGTEAIPYQGLVLTNGDLRLPTISKTGEAVELFGARSHVRVWYAEPLSWRVDRLSVAGEVDTYADVAGFWQWDSNRKVFERKRLDLQLRLPRTSDLLPPALGRRLIASMGARDSVISLPVKRIAGRDSQGFRLTPKLPASTIDHADIWIDGGSQLPLQVAVYAKGVALPTLESSFEDFSLAKPAHSLVDYEPPPGSRIEGDDNDLDVVQLAQIFSRRRLPDSIAGLARRTPEATSVASYGVGFDVVDVASVRQANAAQFVPSGLVESTRPWGGKARILQTDLVNALIFQTARSAIVLSGPVTIEELDRVAAVVVAMSPPL